jgi:hypothetical protein
MSENQSSGKPMQFLKDVAGLLIGAWVCMVLLLAAMFVSWSTFGINPWLIARIALLDAAFLGVVSYLQHLITTEKL